MRHRAWQTTAVLIAAVTTAVCPELTTSVRFGPDVFEPIPALDELDWGAVVPGAAVDYWELRAVFDPQDPRILGSGGPVARSALPEDVRARLDAARVENGFGGGCLPAWCYRYIAYVDDEGGVGTVATRGALAGFLAPIASPEEAILLVSAIDGIWWEETGEDTGIAAADGGWELVVFELAASCAPVQTDRVRYRVRTNGGVSEQAREVWMVSEGACI